MYNMQTHRDSLLIDVRWYGEYWREYPIAEHFTLGEAACSDGSPTIKLHPAAILLVSAIRREFGITRINSWYRTPGFNRSINGSEFSKHLYGMAIDVRCDRVTPETVASFADELGAGGVGIYDSFTHVDIAGQNRRWDNRT